MANYTQTNIYRKQMQKLNVNTKEYAELIDMPYEVVKDVIYDKEGDYSMDVKNFFRKNMVDKHQEIENDLDNAKIKVIEIKQDENNKEIDYAEWYDKKYHFDVLKDTLKDINTLLDFENKYIIKVNGIKASHWFYSCLTSKMNYKKRQIKKETINEFAKQLYDIIVNKNIEKYRERNQDLSKDDLFYINWFDNYDIEAFLKETNHTKHDLSKMMGIGYSTVCLICQKKYRAIKRVKQLYNIIKNYEKKVKQSEITVASTTDEPFIADMKAEDEIVNEPYMQVIKENKIMNETNNDLLRKILINRLTDEEKMLIELFGGKVE